MNFGSYSFDKILTFLRQLRLNSDAKDARIPVPSTDAGKEQAFASPVNYLGLVELLGSTAQLFGSASRNGQLTSQAFIEQFPFGGAAQRPPLKFSDS